MTTDLSDLTARELDILALIAEGHSNSAICRRLWITDKTIESHVRRIFIKLGLPPSGALNRRVIAAVAFDRAGREELLAAA